MNTFLLICGLVFSAVQLASADVIHLTEESFDTHVDGSSNILVEFYAPWCGHCKSLAPEWKIAGETFQPEDDIKIAALDTTTADAIAKKYGITGYPTIKYFAKGSTTPVDYDGGRTADTIISWVNDKVGTSRKLKAVPSHVTTLTTESFDALALGSRGALVEFYAPWCGHCKTLAPKYEELGKVFAGDKEVLIAKVDATEDGDLATRFGVTGYPTLKWFPAGSAEAQPYEGARELTDLVEFINTNAGTEREADGSLKPTAGRVEALDTVIATAKYVLSAELVSALTAAAEALDEAVSKKAAAYVAAAQKAVAKGGAAYVTKEITRLSGLINKGNITPESKAGFQARQNVLKAFVDPIEEF